MNVLASALARRVTTGKQFHTKTKETHDVKLKRDEQRKIMSKLECFQV